MTETGLIRVLTAWCAPADGLESAIQKLRSEPAGASVDAADKLTTALGLDLLEGAPQLQLLKDLSRLAFAEVTIPVDSRIQVAHEAAISARIRLTPRHWATGRSGHLVQGKRGSGPQNQVRDR